LISPDEFKKRMARIAKPDGNGSYDYERTHKIADRLMCKTLRDAGFGEGVKIFEEMFKYYS
jgi:hypothetical protein